MSIGLCRHVGKVRTVWERGEASGRVGLWVVSEASLWAARGSQRAPAEKIIGEELHSHQGLRSISLYSFHSGK